LGERLLWYKGVGNVNRSEPMIDDDSYYLRLSTYYGCLGAAMDRRCIVRDENANHSGFDGVNSFYCLFYS